MKDDIFFFVYLAVVSFFSGVIGTIHRAEHKVKDNLTGKVLLILFGGISSVFIGYVVFEISFFYFENQRLCVAISAFCAWSGTKVLLELQNRLLDFVQNYKKGEL